MSSNSISPGEIRLFKATKKGREARIAAATEKAHLEAEAIGPGSTTRFPKKSLFFVSPIVTVRCFVL